MKCNDLNRLLRDNSYPGRGIIVGRSDDERYIVMAYFIMGRSVNSRNRVFAAEGSGIVTRAYDESLMTDPSLIIYAPVRVCGEHTVITNGDQTDTICDFLESGKSFEHALRTRLFEPDAPNFTPRISAIADNVQGGYRMSVIKAMDGMPEYPQRFFFDYPCPKAGEGHFIHTYRRDGSPLPSFEGEPVRVKLEGGIDDFSHELWESMSEQNRVSLFVRYQNPATGRAHTRIINKNA